MENIQQNDQCQRPGCKCGRPSGGNFCSEQCRTAEEGGSAGECMCGHAECGSGGG